MDIASADRFPAIAHQPTVSAERRKRPGKSNGGDFGKGLRWWIVRLGFTAIVTAYSIHFSKIYGPLMMRPSPDDVFYFGDGLNRLKIFSVEGLIPTIKSIINTPPHAPFSTILAAISFSIFGRYDWAPYAGNSVLVLALFLATDWCLGRAKPWQRLAAYALVVSNRIPSTMVSEFRPDMAWGLVSAFAILFTLRSTLVRSTLRHKIFVGLYWGLALYIKPSTCVLTLMLFAMSISLAVCLDFLPIRRLKKINPQFLGQVASALIIPILVAVAVSISYYAVAWRETWHYIYINIFGSQKDVWAYRGTPLEIWRYFYDGVGGDFFVGARHVYLLSAVAIAGMFVSLMRGRWKNSPRVFAIILTIVVAYVVPTRVVSKNPYFGAIFVYLLQFTAIMAFRAFSLRGSRPIGKWLIMAASVLSLAMMQAPYRVGWVFEPHVVFSNRLVEQVYHTISNRRETARVFIPLEGMSVASATLEYLSMLDGKQGLTFVSLAGENWSNEANLIEQMNEADFVVVGDPMNSEGLDYLPNSRDAAHYIELVSAMPRFERLAAFPTSDGKFYYVYGPHPVDISPGLQLTGFSDEYGPFPDRHVPAFKTGYGPASQIAFHSDRESVQVLTIECSTLEVAQSISVLLDGKMINHHPLPANPASDRFDLFSDELKVGPGEHVIELRYDHWAGTGSPNAVLFKSIHVTAK